MGKNKADDDGVKDDGGKGATRLFQVGLGVFFLMMIGSLWLTIFPDAAAKIEATDSRALQKLFSGGSPAFVLCSRDADNKFISSVFGGARAHLRSENVDTVIVECDKPTKSGKTIRERYNLGHQQPTWFLLADGAKPRVIAPTFSSGAKLADEVLKKHVKKEVKVKALGNTIDLNNCLTERSGGCIVAFSTRETKHVDADLLPIARSHRSITFARLPAGQLALRTKQGVEDGFQALLKDAIKTAKDNAQGTGHRGELLILLKRGVSSPSEILVTIGQVQRPGEITAKDIDALLADHKAAVTVVKGVEAGGNSEGAAAVVEDLADRLLSRDEDLAARSSVLVAKDSLYVGRVEQKKKKQAQQQQGGEQKAATGLSMDQEARRLARQKLRDEQREKGSIEDEERTSGDAETTEGDAAPAIDPKEVERQRREQMEREAAESGFVAHLAEGDEEEDGSGHHHAQGKQEEESFDLDSGYDEL
jgi:hypothetical protein